MDYFQKYFYRYKKIFLSLSLLGFFVVISKFSGLIKEIYFAKIFGVSVDVDFYFFYLAIFAWPAAIMLTILSSIFIPVIVSLEKYQRDVFIGELTGIGLLVSLILFLSFFVFEDFILNLFPYKQSIPDFAMSYSSFVLLVPIFACISLFSVLIMSSGDKINTLFEVIPAIMLLLYFIFFASGDLNGLINATLLAFATQILCLIVFWKIKNKLIPIRFSFSSKSWKKSFSNFTIIILSTILLSTVSLVDQFFSVNLSAESVSLLNYANKLIIAIFGIGALVIQRTFLPDFSLMEKNKTLQKYDAINWYLLIFLLASALILILTCYAESILGLMFLRGDFTQEDLQTIIPIFQFGLIQIPFYFSSLVLVQFYLVKKHIWIVAISGIVASFLKIPLNYILLESFGLIGLNLATSIMYIVSFIVLSLYFFKSKQIENANN